MKKIMNLKNERGLTLVELLAVTVIIAMVGALLTGVIIAIQKQYTSQSDAIGKLTDVTIAAKAITLDLRSADINSVVSEDTNKLELKIEGETKVYEFVDDVLQLNGSDYLYRVNDFHVEIAEEKPLVKMTISSSENKHLSIEIYLREEF